MMGKRKVFIETDLSIPQVHHIRDAFGDVHLLPNTVSATDTNIVFSRSASSGRNFDFARWYGVGIDSITYACQIQIKRFLAGQDMAVTVATVHACCASALRVFLDYCMMRAVALNRELVLSDINRDMIDGYLGHLATKGISTVSQKTIYDQTKRVLHALGRRDLFTLITFGDAATFPRNPYPNVKHKVKGETALSTRELKALTMALRHAIRPIWDDNVSVTSDLLACVLLLIALHTGRNTTPLLEMDRNCLRPHPKNDTVFLVLWKRRGYSHSKVALRANSSAENLVELTPSVKISIERLIRRVMALTEPLDVVAPDDIRGRVWLYRMRCRTSVGPITVLTGGVLEEAKKRLIDKYGLWGDDGEPLRLNISRLRKTFANRVFELTGGDLTATAAALGSTLPIKTTSLLTIVHAGTGASWANC